MKKVPTSEFAPVLRRLIAENDESHLTVGKRAGIDESTISKILQQQNQFVAFDTCDKLLCALGSPQTWWNELRDIYYAVDLADIDRVREYRDHYCKRHGSNRALIYMNAGRPASNCPVCQSEAKRRHRARKRNGELPLALRHELPHEREAA